MRLSYIWIIICFVFFQLHSAGADILSMRSNIKRGFLKSGLAYYIVSNPQTKGLADVTLIQNSGFSDEGNNKGMSVVVARENLSQLTHVSSPFLLMNRIGVYPGDKGYVNINDYSTIYTFPDIMVYGSGDNFDSVLMMAFDIISKSSETYPSYFPGNQCLIISGDIDANSVLEKINALSLLLKKTPEIRQKKENESLSKNTEFVKIVSPPADGFVSLTAEYTLPSYDKQHANSLQYLVTNKFMKELEFFVEERLKESLYRSDIPYAGIISAYETPSSGFGTEKLKFGFIVEKRNLIPATDILSEVLVSCGRQISETDYKYVHEYVKSTFLPKSNVTDGNKTYSEQCKNYHLFGSPLNSDVATYDFLYKKKIDFSQEQKYFLQISSAVLNQKNNLRLYVGAAYSPDLKQNVKDIFGKDRGKIFYPDLTASPKMRGNAGKVKIKSQEKETLFNGTIYNLNNGMRVVYKRTASSKNINFALSINKGYSSSKINFGTKSILPDFYKNAKIGNSDGRMFFNFLISNGINMKLDISAYDFKISGTASSDKLTMLFQSLLTMGYDVGINEESFKYWDKTRKLRRRFELSKSSGPAGRKLREHIIDSLMFEGANGPADLSRAESFYKSVFSKVNDGIMVITGDISKEELIKVLLRYAGGFKTSGTVARNVKEEVQSGKNINHSEKGNCSSMDLVLSAPLDYALDQYVMAAVAAKFYHSRLAAVAAKKGWRTESETKLEIFPSSRYKIFFHFDLLPEATLPGSMLRDTEVHNLKREIEKEIYRACRFGIDAETMSDFKSMVVGQHDTDAKNEKNMVDNLVIRYTYSKDMVSDCAKKADKVTLKQMNDFILSLGTGKKIFSTIKSESRPEKVKEAIIPFPEIPAIQHAEIVDSLGIAQLYKKMFDHE